jgi:hypothetical protein
MAKMIFGGGRGGPGWCGHATAGVGEQAGDGLGGGVGEGGVDGDLVQVVVVDGADVQGIQETFDEAVRGAGEDVAQDRQGVQQGGVVVLGGGGLQGGQLGFDPGPLGVQVGEPGADALPEGLGGGVAGCGGCFQFGDEGVFCGVDLGEPAAERGGLVLALGGLAGGAGGQGGGEHDGPVRPEHPLAKNLFGNPYDAGRSDVFSGAGETRVTGTLCGVSVREFRERGPDDRDLCRSTDHLGPRILRVRPQCDASAVPPASAAVPGSRGTPPT